MVKDFTVFLSSDIISPRVSLYWPDYRFQYSSVMNFNVFLIASGIRSTHVSLCIGLTTVSNFPFTMDSNVFYVPLMYETNVFFCIDLTTDSNFPLVMDFNVSPS